jgi:RP/EB family microtubule-associated protein
MNRVKMNAKHEYEYVANYKVMQNVFKAKKIDKVRVFSLSFCLTLIFLFPVAHTRRKAREMQNAVRVPDFSLSHDTRSTIPHRDNLEFLQWMKRFWDANYGGQGYDAVARRKGAPAEPPATIAPLPSSKPALSAGGARSGGRTPVGGYRTGSAQPSEAVQQLQGQVKELSSHLEGLEKERDFYFEKAGLMSTSLQRVLTTSISCVTSKSLFSSN